MRVTLKKLCLLLVVGTFLVSSLALADKPFKVVLVHSYHEGFQWSHKTELGLREGMLKQGFLEANYSISHTFYLDAILHHDKAETKAKQVLKEILTIKPDAVVVTDDDAMRLVGIELNTTPVIFTGVNDPFAYLGEYSNNKIISFDSPSGNITGTYQKPYFSQNLSLLKQLQPKAKRIVVIGDESTTCELMLKRMISTPLDNDMQLVDFHLSNDFGEWKSKITQWQKNADALFFILGNAVQDKGKVMPMADVVSWIVDNSNLIDFTFWEQPVEEGISFAAADDPILQGLNAAVQLSRILKGVDIARIPIITPDRGTPVINMTRMEKLNISPSVKSLGVFVTEGRVHH